MNRYEIVSELARGGEGSATLVRRISDGGKFVLKKKICMNIDEVNEGLQEGLAMAKLQSSNVVKYEDIFLIEKQQVSMLSVIISEGCSKLEF